MVFLVLELQDKLSPSRLLVADALYALRMVSHKEKEGLVSCRDWSHDQVECSIPYLDDAFSHDLLHLPALPS
jgi:hypothetical protein